VQLGLDDAQRNIPTRVGSTADSVQSATTIRILLGLEQHRRAVRSCWTACLSDRLPAPAASIPRTCF